MVECIAEILFDWLERSEIDHPSILVECFCCKGQLEAQRITVQEAAVRLGAMLPEASAKPLLMPVGLSDEMHGQFSSLAYWMTSGISLMAKAVFRMKQGPHLPQ